MSIQEDIKFAQDAEEMNSSQILRYVAAINPEATREQFVAAAVAMGFPANSSANRFRESRTESLRLASECGEKLSLEKDGKLVELLD